MLIAEEFTQFFWTIPHRLRALLRRRELEEELDDEFRSYVGMRAEQLVIEGLSPAQAGEAARREFDGIEQTKEQCRDARGVRWAEEFFQDSRYAMRGLRRTPVFAVVAVGLVALSIAASLFVASVLGALFFTPLPYRNPKQLVSFGQELTSFRPGGLGMPFSWLEIADLREHVPCVEQIATFRYAVMDVGGGDGIKRVRGATVSPNLFGVLGVRPLLGEVFSSTTDGVVISDRLWRELYASDPALIGRQISLNGAMRTVLGIMPADFEFPLVGFTAQRPQLRAADLWEPLVPLREESEDRAARAFRIVGRMKPRVELQELRRELEGVSESWKRDDASLYATGGLRATQLKRWVDPRMRWAAVVLAVAILAMWLIAVANLTAIMLARANTARRQTAIRMALGAGPLRLLRQAMSEGVILALVGGIGGLFLGTAGVALFRATGDQSSPLIAHLRISPLVELAAIGLAIVTGLFLAFVPGRDAVRQATVDALKDRRSNHRVSDRRRGMRNRLVVLETALALVLLVGAGMLSKSLIRLRDVDPGFNAAGVVTTDLFLPASEYSETSGMVDCLSKVMSEVSRLPGVAGAACISSIPFGGGNSDRTFSIENDPNPGRVTPPDEVVRIVTPEYFRVLQISVSSGRAFDSSDVATSGLVVVVNRALAFRYWGTKEVVGKRIKLDYPKWSGWRTIVGVVGSIKHDALDVPPEPELYVPYTQNPVRRMVLAVRAEKNPQEAIAMVAGKVNAFDPQLVLAHPRALDQAIGDSIFPRMFTANAVAVFAIIGLLLAVGGVYAVVAYTVVERKHEIAVRMAVGADRWRVIAMVLAQVGRLLAAGTALGVAIAVGASFLLKPFLYDAPTFDAPLFLGAIGFLNLCGLAAAFIPAWRAAKLNLARTLAHD